MTVVMGKCKLAVIDSTYHIINHFTCIISIVAEYIVIIIDFYYFASNASLLNKQKD